MAQGWGSLGSSCYSEAQNVGFMFSYLPDLARSFSNRSRKCVLSCEISQFSVDDNSFNKFKSPCGSNTVRGHPHIRMCLLPKTRREK